MSASRLAALALLAAPLAACTPENQPATGAARPERVEIAEPYRGSPVALALSADGAIAAIAFETAGPSNTRRAGFLVVDARDGRLVFARPAIPGRLRSIALSADGGTVVTAWGCTPGDTACTGTRVMETDLGARIESVRLQFSEELHGAWHDPAEPGRLLALVAPARPLPGGDVAPTGRLRLFALPRGAAPGTAAEIGAWDIGALVGAAPATPLPGGGLRLVAREGSGPLQDATLRPGAVASLAPLGGGMAGLAAPQIVQAPGGAVAIGVAADGTAPRITDDVMLVRRGEGTGRRLGQRAEVPLVAISADGRRAAFVAIPLEAADPHPVLHVVDTEAGAPRRLEALAQNGVGRTWTRARIAPADLLGRLKALSENGQLVDPAAAGQALGLRLRFGDAPGFAPGQTVDGDLAPFGAESTYTVTEARAGAGAWSAHLRLALHAGPCLTPAAVQAAFGPPTRMDAPPAVVAPGRPRQPRESLDYVQQTGGGSARFEFGQQGCARVVELRQGAR